MASSSPTTVWSQPQAAGGPNVSTMSPLYAAVRRRSSFLDTAIGSAHRLEAVHLPQDATPPRRSSMLWIPPTSATALEMVDVDARGYMYEGDESSFSSSDEGSGRSGDWSDEEDPGSRALQNAAREAQPQSPGPDSDGPQVTADRTSIRSPPTGGADTRGQTTPATAAAPTPTPAPGSAPALEPASAPSGDSGGNSALSEGLRRTGASATHSPPSAARPAPGSMVVGSRIGQRAGDGKAGEAKGVRAEGPVGGAKAPRRQPSKSSKRSRRDRQQSSEGRSSTRRSKGKGATSSTRATDRRRRSSSGMSASQLGGRRRLSSIGNDLAATFPALTPPQYQEVLAHQQSGMSQRAAAALVMVEARAERAKISVDDYVTRYLRSHVEISTPEQVLVAHLLMAMGQPEVKALACAPNAARGVFLYKYHRGCIKSNLWVRHSPSSFFSPRKFFGFLATMYSLFHFVTVSVLALGDLQWWRLNPEDFSSDHPHIIYWIRVVNVFNFGISLLQARYILFGDLVGEQLQQSGYQGSFLNRLRTLLAPAIALDMVGVGVFLYSSKDSFKIAKTAYIMSYGLLFSGYLNPSHFALYDVLTAPAFWMDWVKVLVLDLLFNWVVIATTLLVTVFVLVTFPVTLVMTVCLQLRLCPGAVRVWFRLVQAVASLGQGTG